jgi:hypothetical protein
VNYIQLSQAIQDYAENTESLFVTNIPTFVKEAEERIYNTVQLPALRKNVFGTMTQYNGYVSLPDDWLSPFSVAVIDAAGNYNYLLNKDVNFIREAYPNAGNAYSGMPRFYSLFGPQYTNINELTLLVGPSPDANYTVEMHYYYYPPTIVQGQIATFALPFTSGSGYTNGVYSNVPLTTSSTNGSNATATLQIVGGNVVTCTLTNGGSLYTAGNVLSFDANAMGAGSGTGFSITVATVSNPTGTSWLGDNYDPALFYGAMREAMIFMKGEQDMVAYYEQKYQEAIQQLIRLGAGLERGDTYRNGQAKIVVNP